ncbi:MAG TPA: hypothetical protein VMN37_06270, partial [Gemmatimonadales bacterium]|nr:hypothetical protein [Gemmatimonadales bacterium]
APNAALPSLALSPDGASLAIREAVQNGRLWIKRRGELHAVPVAGTERSSHPAFSPDGQWLAFLADGRLKKIRPGEGAAITLAEPAASPFGGATWLDDGTLIYVGPTLFDLSRVSAQGGPSTPVLRDSTLLGFGLATPTPLPDGRGVLFTACNSGCVTMSVHLLDLRTGRQRLLLNDAVTASYLPTGHLLYIRRDGVALAAPFDLDRMETTAGAVPVLEGVLSNGGVAYLAWSPSGTLAYLQGTAASPEFEAVQVTREGLVTPIDTLWHGGFNSLALAPDGRRMAVGVGLASGALSIWVKQLDRGPFSRLTFGGQDRRPVWSPDGRVVAFLRDSLSSTRVYERRADGSTPDRLLVGLDRQVQEAAWSPDGRWLLLRTDNGTAGAGDLVGVRTDGDTTPVPLVASEFTELHPSVSPDNRWIAYTSNESGANEVYVRPFPATSGGRWQVSNGGGMQPRWSPEGRELFYLDGTQRLMAAQVRRGPTFEVTELRPLFDGSGLAVDFFHLSYGVLAGGRGFVFLRPRSAQSAVTPMVRAQGWFADIRARSAR